jgi:hypothetical protein
MPAGGTPGSVGGGTYGILTAEQVAAMAYGAGFRGDSLRTAVAVSFAENGRHDTNAQNHNTDGSTDYGLWQINSVHGIPQSELVIPQKNAAAAYRISSSGRNWQPWTTYTSNKYAASLPAAQAAITKMAADGGANAVAKGVHGKEGGSGSSLAGDLGISNPLDALTGWVGDLKNLIADYTLRAFEMLGGLILIFVGIFLIAKDLGFSPPAAIPIPV